MAGGKTGQSHAGSSVPGGKAADRVCLRDDYLRAAADPWPDDWACGDYRCRDPKPGAHYSWRRVALCLHGTDAGDGGAATGCAGHSESDLSADELLLRIVDADKGTA